MRISIVIPFYNLERYVRPCLDSVCAAYAKLRSKVEVEVLCIDDGSTDDTPALLDVYAQTHNLETPQPFTFRVLHQPNRGEGGARNAGLEVAIGDWVTFLDGDDVWLENHLAVAQPILAAHSTADMMAFRYASFDDGAEPPKPLDDSTPKVFNTRSELPSELLLEVGVFPTFFRREFLASARFSTLPLGADRLFVAEALSRADEVVKVDVTVHGYRIRSGSMARLAWGARKVMSQCDYAVGALAALVASGKTLGADGHAYLASLWLSDVPNRLRRLPRGERKVAWSEWHTTLGRAELVQALPRFRCARRLLAHVGFSMILSLGLARLMRKGGLT